MAEPGGTVPLAPGIEGVPILHGRLEFAAAVRRAIQELSPQAVAVELPATLDALVRRAVVRLPALTVITAEGDGGQKLLVPVSPQDGIFEAARSALEAGIPLHLVDQEVDGYPASLDLYPDPYAVARLGAARYYELVKDLGVLTPLDELRERAMAHHLARLARDGGRVLFVGGLFHFEGLKRRLEEPEPPRVLGRVRPRTGVVHEVAEETVRTLLYMGEPPWLVAAWELARRERLPAPDRARLSRALVAEAGARYRRETGERISAHQLRVLVQYARSMARRDGKLVPDLFQLVSAARGAVDDNFAHAVLELGMAYPFRDASGQLPRRAITPEELEWMRTSFLRLHPKVRSVRRRPLAVPLPMRKREKKPGEWKERFARAAKGPCSYPPEDLVIEAAGRRLKDRAKTVLEEISSRSERFTGSLCDGPDLRETLRHWSQGELWVRRQHPLAGGVGNLVVVFDEDPVRYPWQVTWWGEHEQESDMAFYATAPEAQVTGPGVARCEYGGFLLSYPPGRLYDVWDDPYFDGAESRAERLLMAAIEYSEERFVAYVAAKPPRSAMRSYAERFDRRIVYLPLGSLPGPTRKKIRVFHVLADQTVRATAKDYVW